MSGEDTDPLVNPSAYVLEVAEILVDFSQSNSRYLLSSQWHWGSKRWRSPAPTLIAPSPQAIRICESTSPAVKGEASSPAMPLSFSTSESEEKPKHPKNKLRDKEELMKTIEEFTQANRTFVREISNVELFMDTLKKYNMKLKARKELLIRRETEACLHKQNQKRLKLEMESCHLSLNRGTQSQTCYHRAIPISIYGPPSHSNPTPHWNGVRTPPFFTPIARVAKDDGGPLDFNLPAAVDSVQDDRVRAAEARQKRIQIYKSKNSTGFCRPRCGGN